MIRRACLLMLMVAACGAMGACTSEPEKKPVGPTSETSKIPWNRPVAGQGQGQFGMLPQNNYRR